MPVDWVNPLDGPSEYVGRRRAAASSVPAEPASYTPPVEDHPKVDLDTGSIERVLSALEPVDQTTSFEHELTERLPLLRSEPPAPGGKRRAVKHAGGRGPLFKGLPSAPVLLGIAALAVSIGGAVTVSDVQPAGGGSDAGTVTHAASALGGSSGTVLARGNNVTRDSDRQAQADAAGEQLKAAAEGAAAEHATAIKELAGKAEGYAKVLAKDVWEYPLSSVVLTARFGQYGLWSSYHTGLDFNGDTGDTIVSMTNGEVISASYDGAYGNKTVVRLEDGTEIWYCHQNTFNVSVGDTVTRGEAIGTVGSTGHVTGSHLHVEVRPGGGDPVDPYTAMQQHGLF